MNAERATTQQADTRRFWISGRVQSVGFRFFVERCATALGIRGWVRNLPDGRVEVLAFGAPDALIRLEASLHSGPRGASVEQVITETVPQGDEPGPDTFAIRRN
ncbi:MAG: acylphosphatase [Gammaproteobacteria bacterium]